MLVTEYNLFHNHQGLKEACKVRIFAHLAIIRAHQNMRKGEAPQKVETIFIDSLLHSIMILF